ncbi:hypothetical protein F5Y15DRAFT_60553 [Xylariaceae sp. FL0016]|nr:hypothetical protein F5Y15DRAFT_60553 [Xylariaceae sp. FL0016]
MPMADPALFFNPLPDPSTMAPQQPSPSSMGQPTTSPINSVSLTQKPDLKRRSPADDLDPTTALKRQRNNVAARKYRQKRIDRISELESELSEVKQERDDLRIRLARQEAEAAALRSMLQMKSGNDAKG